MSSPTATSCTSVSIPERRPANARSAPQLLAGDASAVGKRLELGPDDRRMHLVRSRERGEAAVGAGNDALAADHLREAAEPLGHQFGMLDQHRRLRDDAGQQNLVVGNPGALPLLVFMLVARVRRLEGETLRLYLEDNVDDVLELHVMDARPHVDAVAG